MLKTNRHFYIITSSGPVSVLGGVTAPIKVAIELTPYQAYCTVSEGHTVYEVNQYDHKEKYKVTKENYNKIAFKTSKTAMIKKKRMLEEIKGIKHETKLSASKKVDKKIESKKKLEENEGKSNLIPEPKVEESAFKVTDFEKQK